MDPVVWFALGTLTVVFFLSGFVLIALVWRRCQQQNARSSAEVNFIFSKSRDDKVENLAEMVPLLDTEMGKLELANVEAGKKGSPLSDVMAILSLTTRVVKVLSEVSVTRASPKIYDVIAQSMFRVDTHFHELLEFTPVEAGDIRVIEARALTLTTTVWSLNAAFTLHGFDQVKEVEAMVIEMYEHVDALRQQIPGYEGRKNGEEREEREEEDEKTGSQTTEETTAETTPGDAPVDAAVVVTHHPIPPVPIEVVVEVNEPPQDEDTPAAPAAAAASNEDDSLPVPSSPSKSDSAPIPVANGSPDQSVPPSDSSVPPKTEDVVDSLSQS